MSLDTTEGIGVVEGNDVTMTEESPNKKEPEKELQGIKDHGSFCFRFLFHQKLNSEIRFFFGWGRG